MRILFVQKDLYERSTGGSEFYEHHLLRELAARHEVRILCSRSGLASAASPELTQRDGFAVTEVTPNNEIFPGSKNEQRLLAATEDLLDGYSPDVVHIQDLYRLSLRIPEITNRRGIPVVHTVHEYFLLCPRLILRTTADRLCLGPTMLGCFRCARSMARDRYSPSPCSSEPWVKRQEQHWKAFAQRRASEVHFAFGRRLKVRSAIRSIDLLLCPSQYLHDRLQEAGIPRQKLRLLGYALPDLGPLRPKKPSERLRFAFIGQVAPHKGIFVLLEAARSVPEADFVIYGPLPGPVAPLLKQRLAELPNVRLGGMISDRDKAEAYASIDVLVVPSIWYENQPITILEAFQFRSPVVASRLGGLEELLQRGGGWLVPPDDPRALAGRLRHLSAHRDEILAMAHSIPAVETMSSHARTVERIYEEVVGADARGGKR